MARHSATVISGPDGKSSQATPTPPRRGRWRGPVVVAMAIGLAAFNSGNNVFYLVTSSLLAMVLISALAGRRAALDIRIRAITDEGLFALHEAIVRLEVRTTRGVPGVALEHESIVRPVIAALGSTPTSVPVSLRARARGLEALEGLRVTAGSPFGLTTHLRRMQLLAPLLVYPTPAPEYNLDREIERSVSGEILSAEPGRGPEFLTLRDYRPEDGVRRVYWKGLARTGQLLSVQNERDDRRTITIRVEATIPADTPAWRERFEHQLCLATAAAVQAHAMGLPFRFESPPVTLPAAASLSHRNRALAVLALLQPTVGDPATIDENGDSVLVFRADRRKR